MLPLFTCAAFEVAWIELANCVAAAMALSPSAGQLGLHGADCAVVRDVRGDGGEDLEQHAHRDEPGGEPATAAEGADGRVDRQINPHFLFNTLNTVSSLIRFDPDMARGVVLKLSNILRRLLRKHETFVPLREELEFIDDYLDIEVIRFGRDKLQIFKEIDEEARESFVPSMLLQPIIENSIKHGIAPRLEGGEIHLRSTLKDGRLRSRSTTTAWAFRQSGWWMYTAAGSASATCTRGSGCSMATNSKWTFAARKAKARRFASKFRRYRRSLPLFVRNRVDPAFSCEYHYVFSCLHGFRDGRRGRGLRT